MKNIFVFGADEFNLAQMRSLQCAQSYRFHELFKHREVKAGPEFPVEASETTFAWETAATGDEPAVECLGACPGLS